MSARGRRFRLLAVWLVLGVLAGMIVWLERADRVGPTPRRPGPADARVRLLLPVPVNALGAVEIVQAHTRHRFERDPTGAWFYHHDGALPSDERHHHHHAEAALARRIADAFAAFGRTRIERQFALAPHADPYGVKTSGMHIRLYRPHERQPLIQYAIGAMAPDTVSRYVWVVDRPDVVTIPAYQIDNLTALLRDVAGPSAATPFRP